MAEHIEKTTPIYSAALKNQQVWKCVRGTHPCDEELAATFVALLRMVVDRDEVTVLAGCLLGN